MKRKLTYPLIFLCSGFFFQATAFSASLSTAARSVIPSQVQQIINVDYRRMKNSDTAMAMKTKLLPENLKQFETALKSIGVDPDRDLDTITLASFRTKSNGLQIVGVAQGQFPRKKLRLRLAKHKISGKKMNGSLVYPMAGGMQMTFLNDWTMLFGDRAALQAALDARDGSGMSLNANSEVTDMISSVDQGTVWSVLDAQGTQAMLKSALGTAANLSEYDSLKKQLTGSRYTVDFDHGVEFSLSVLTSDSIAASTLSSVLKAGLLFKKMNASPIEKSAIEDTTVDSDSGSLVVHFKADDKSFQSLLDAPMFAAVTR